MSASANTATGIQAIGEGVQGIFSGVRGAMSASAIRDQTRFAEARFDLASRMAEFEAEQTLKFSNRKVNESRRQAGQLAASQRAGIAAGNVDVLSGSAARGRRDIEFFSDLDEATIRDMARQVAHGQRVNAQDFQFQGIMSRMSGEFRANASIISGMNGMMNRFARAQRRLIRGGVFDTGEEGLKAPKGGDVMPSDIDKSEV